MRIKRIDLLKSLYLVHLEDSSGKYNVTVENPTLEEIRAAAKRQFNKTVQDPDTDKDFPAPKTIFDVADDEKISTEQV